MKWFHCRKTHQLQSMLITNNETQFIDQIIEPYAARAIQYC